MTVKQNRKIFWCLAISFICLAALSICMTSCRLQSSDLAQNGLNKENIPSTQEDAYEAKILYYEAKLQSLMTQMSDMEQQMYLLREDYIKGFQTLEQKISESNHLVNDGNVSDEQVPSQDETSDTAASPQQPSHDDGGEFTVCEYTYQLKNNFAVLTSYLGKDEYVTVPAAVDGYLVIALADRTFADCDVRSVKLPETVESIGWFTFYGCENLEKVTLPAKLSSIGYASFDGCAPTLCLYVKSGSYAEQFADSFGLRFEQSS